MKINSAEKLRKRQALREMVYRRRYLVPNLVTVGNMFCGYLAIIYASSHRFENAVIAIALAILLDGLDGRVARKLNATSKFGMEFDSFSDVVSFGVAPAVLVYNWAYLPLADEFGVFVTFLYLLCGASRLARFNLSSDNLKYFTGLPIPGAAGTVLGLIYLLPESTPSTLFITLTSILMLSLAYLMVSEIEFVSLKSFRMQRIGLFGRILLGGLLALVWYYRHFAIFAVMMMYCASGPLHVNQWLSRKPKSALPN